MLNELRFILNKGCIYIQDMCIIYQIILYHKMGLKYENHYNIKEERRK
jgi:hypothetical protein